MPPPWVWTMHGIGPSAPSGRWMYRLMSLPSTPVITSVRELTPLVCGVLETTKSPSALKPASASRQYASNSSIELAAVTGDGGGATSIPSTSVAAIIRGVGTRIADFIGQKHRWLISGYWLEFLNDRGEAERFACIKSQRDRNLCAESSRAKAVQHQLVTDRLHNEATV